MSKKKRKSLQAPSRTPEKYLSNLKQKSVSETSSTEPIEDYSDSTDSRVVDEKIYTRKSSKENSFIKFLNDFGKPIGILVAIGSAIALLFGTLNFFGTLTSDLTHIKSDISRFESETKESFKDVKERQDDIRFTLVRIVEKFERLFDRFDAHSDEKAKNNKEK